MPDYLEIFKRKVDTGDGHADILLDEHVPDQLKPLPRPDEVASDEEE